MELKVLFVKAGVNFAFAVTLTQLLRKSESYNKIFYVSAFK